MKWWWEMDCLAVLLTQNPHAHRSALSNQMFRLHCISCLTRLRRDLPPPHYKKKAPHLRCIIFEMVVGDGFEPSKAVLADLQSAPFGRSGIQPHNFFIQRMALERVTGVEPVYPAWKAGAQPLCHTRKRLLNPGVC